jgi:serine/threonine-protein kinase
MAKETAEAIFAAWAARIEGGETLEFGDLLREHPPHVEDLRELYDDWTLFAPLLGRVVPGLIASDAGVHLPSLSGNDEDEPQSASAELLEHLGIHAPDAGRYRFRAVLGRGGGGVVLKVWDTKLNRPLAMKVVLGREEHPPGGETPRVDGRTLTRFVDEARIASQLNHPGIVPIHELGADETGRAFFTMRLVKGENLSAVLEHVKTGRDGWNQTRALGVLLKVCDAMAFAHDKGVVHRDLKPANVMIGKYGEVYVMDWGLARVLSEPDRRDIRIECQPATAESAVASLRTRERGELPDSPLITMDGTVLGTPVYMSP